ncbi:MAG: SpoIIE family protein phosphatase [Planctomycetes bacterium]|nr:SpoIIE family protein phosphatase [Planctomycetota bacterium]
MSVDAQPPCALIAVRDASAAAAARAEARRVADALAWPAEAREELALCASELAMNVVDHGRARGSVMVVAAPDGAFIEVGAQDAGGGLDPARVGVPSAPGRGGGLPTLGRLMDVTTLASADGLLAWGRRWAPAADGPRRRAPLRAAIVQRARQGERVCGDAAAVERRQGGARLAVVDGLGHGPAAAEAALACLRALARALDAPLEVALRATHAAAAGTRGAALAVVDVDEVRRAAQAAVIGNCRLEVLGPEGRRSVVGVPGVVGHGASPAPRIEALALRPGAALVLSTDGLSPRARLAGPPRREDLLAGACQLFAAHAGAADDATVLVASLE